MLDYHKETQELYIAALYTALYILQHFTPHFTFYNTFTFLQRFTFYNATTVYHAVTVYCLATVYYPVTVYYAAALVLRISHDLLKLAQLCLSEFFSHRHTQCCTPAC